MSCVLLLSLGFYITHGMFVLNPGIPSVVFVLIRLGFNSMNPNPRQAELLKEERRLETVTVEALESMHKCERGSSLS